MTVGPAPIIVASCNRARRKITAHFMARHAISPGDAIRYSPQHPIERRQFERMLAWGVIKPVRHEYWLDTVAYNQDRMRRQSRVGLIAGTLAVVAALALMLLYRG